LHVEMTSNTVQAVRTHGVPNRRCHRTPGTFLLPLVFETIYYEIPYWNYTFIIFEWIRLQIISAEQGSLFNWNWNKVLSRFGNSS
jgi:hypothetical protein